MELKGAVAIVTGGGTGIGQATSLRLAQAGCRAVIVNYASSQAEAEETAASLAQHGCEGVAVRADVSSDTDCRRMLADAVGRFGRVDVLINNAGTTRYIDFPDLEAVTEEVWRLILATNLLGPFFCSRAAGPELKRARGAIVNVASIAGHRPGGSSLPYGVSKAGLLQLTRALARALAPEVRVNSVSPGFVSTRWARSKRGDRFADESEAKAISQAPMRAVASADHVAQAIMGLVLSDIVTGQDVIVDGGTHLNY